MTAQHDEAKRTAARAALAELPAAGTIGLGTGSTAQFFIAAIGELVAAGHRYVGVPTSEASRVQAEQLGIPLLDDDVPWNIAVTVDGADEVDGALHLIKGGGGAHTREKIINHCSHRNVIIVDESKLSTHLGDRRPVPIAVLRYAHLSTKHHLTRLGEPVLRTRGGRIVVDDNGNLIYDLECGPIRDPAALDRDLHAIPGVVETGLFVGRADVVLVAGAHGVRRLVR